MTMVFCRGCGKEIHNTAPTCPHCGASQDNPVTSKSGTQGSSKWVAIASLVFGIFTLLSSFAFMDEGGDVYEIVGAFIWGGVALGFGIMNLAQKRWGKGLAIGGLATGAFGLLIVLGSIG